MNAADRPQLSVGRLIDPGRVGELLAIIHESFGALAIDPPSGALKESVADFAERLRREIVLVAEENGRVLGGVCCVPDHDALYIGRLAVTATARRRGVGDALMVAAEAEARRRGLSHMTLRVRIALADNVAFFRKRGFVVTAEQCHPGYAQPTSYTMRRIVG